MQWHKIQHSIIVWQYVRSDFIYHIQVYRIILYLVVSVIHNSSTLLIFICINMSFHCAIWEWERERRGMSKGISGLFRVQPLWHVDFSDSLSFHDRALTKRPWVIVRRAESNLLWTCKSATAPMTSDRSCHLHDFMTSLVAAHYYWRHTHLLLPATHDSRNCMCVHNVRLELK